MSLDPVTAGIDLVTKALDKFVKDPEQRDKAKLELLQAKASGELKEMEVQMSAIMAEANSDDRWTSRARPMFLYVVYLLILMSIPMGVLFAFSPTTAADISLGVNNWFNALPEPLLDLFMVVMLGYVGGRSVEKVAKLRAGKK